MNDVLTSNKSYDLQDLDMWASQIYMIHSQFPSGDTLDTQYFYNLELLTLAEKLGIGATFSVRDILERLIKYLKTNSGKTILKQLFLYGYNMQRIQVILRDFIISVLTGMKEYPKLALKELLHHGMLSNTNMLFCALINTKKTTYKKYFEKILLLLLKTVNESLVLPKTAYFKKHTDVFC